MILALPLPPTPAEVILAALTVIVGALIASVTIGMAVRSHNWLHLIAGAGGLLVVAGVAGQRTVAEGAALGPWDSGIQVPLIGAHIDPVLAAGVIVVLLGATVTLLFERVPDPSRPVRPLVHRPLEDDDTI